MIPAISPAPAGARVQAVAAPARIFRELWQALAGALGQIAPAVWQQLPEVYQAPAGDHVRAALVPYQMMPAC
eukprot:2147642-Amphidinium_carterae.1